MAKQFQRDNRNQRNFIVYDLETSNFTENGGEILHIGAVLVRYQDYKIVIEETFEKFLKPLNPENLSDGALRVIGKDLWDRANEDGLHPKTGLRKFKQFFEKHNTGTSYGTSPIRVGFNNVSFDDKMLNKWMEEYKVIDFSKSKDIPWANFSIDLYPDLFQLFAADSLPNRTLDTFAGLFGVSRQSEFHGALEDAIITAQMFSRYMRFLVYSVRPKMKIDNTKGLKELVATDA